MSEPDHRRGRPHDAEGAREAILNAAEEVFAEHGFDGARIDAIAAAAHYNKSLIFQYFGDKLNLYAEVIRRADDQTRDLQTRALAALFEGNEGGTSYDAGRLRSLLAEFTGAYFDYLVAHPRITRIYLWEMAEGWQTYGKVLTERDYEDIEQFTPIFQDLQKAGILRANVDPLVQFSIAIFMAAFYLGLIPLYRVFFPSVDISSSDGIARGREFVVDFIVQGLMSQTIASKSEREAPRDDGS